MYFLIVVLLLSAYLLYRHFTWQAVPWPENSVKPPVYQGHRGYWKEGAQENTLASFQAAARRGLKMIELDVLISKDQVPVVFHDDDLQRLAGVARLARECTAAELKQWAQACTLEEVILATDIPQMLNIELKTAEIFNDVLEVQIAKIVRKHRCEQRILFSSFNPFSIRRLSRLLPEVPRALLATGEDEPENKIYLRQMWLAPYVKAHALHLDHNYVDAARIAKFKKRNIPVALWTVNDKDKAEAFLKAGALSIITDTLGN